MAAEARELVLHGAIIPGDLARRRLALSFEAAAIVRVYRVINVLFIIIHTTLLVYLMA